MHAISAGPLNEQSKRKLVAKHLNHAAAITVRDRQSLAASKRPIEGVIQTDAAINPGNSGGPQIICTGAATRPGLGISMATNCITRRLGLEGVLILSVMPDSAAQWAGLQPTRRDESGQMILGDIIVGIDGQPVKGTSDLLKTLDAHDVGGTLELTIQRLNQGTTKVAIQLQPLP